ncbi:unnamed protein product, partial [Amoebophrya sp. A25]|eukprot:GSA25T00011585001.1
MRPSLASTRRQSWRDKKDGISVASRGDSPASCLAYLRGLQLSLYVFVIGKAIATSQLLRRWLFHVPSGLHLVNNYPYDSNTNTFVVFPFYSRRSRTSAVIIGLLGVAAQQVKLDVSELKHTGPGPQYVGEEKDPDLVLSNVLIKDQFG